MQSLASAKKPALGGGEKRIGDYLQGEVAFNDDQALVRVLKRAADVPPSLIERLHQADTTGTGRISVSTFVAILGKDLHSPP